jgi:5'-nucleotidase (lipoprotein e(P4) family)
LPDCSMHSYRRLAFILTALLMMAACSARKNVSQTSIANDGKAWAALWQQRAAEYKALCLQAYNIARVRVDEAVKQPSAKPLAIVTDIDETVLDNSPYDMQRALANQEYTVNTWKEWTARAQADTVPGAPSFFKYAASKGIRIFYVTNRDADETASTLKNLQRFGFPDADAAHFLPRATSSSKEARRREIAKNHSIILLCGDNLADFDALYDSHPSEARRDSVTASLSRQFGNRYIVLPNPSYGDWEGALYKFNYNLTPAQKDSLIKSVAKQPH